MCIFLINQVIRLLGLLKQLIDYQRVMKGNCCLYLIIFIRSKTSVLFFLIHLLIAKFIHLNRRIYYQVHIYSHADTQLVQTVFTAITIFSKGYSKSVIHDKGRILNFKSFFIILIFKTKDGKILKIFLITKRAKLKSALNH